MRESTCPNFAWTTVETITCELRAFRVGSLANGDMSGGEEEPS